jgi:hypothetical protein
MAVMDKESGIFFERYYPWAAHFHITSISELRI